MWHFVDFIYASSVSHILLLNHMKFANHIAFVKKLHVYSPVCQRGYSSSRCHIQLILRWYRNNTEIKLNCCLHSVWRALVQCRPSHLDHSVRIMRLVCFSFIYTSATRAKKWYLFSFISFLILVLLVPSYNGVCFPFSYTSPTKAKKVYLTSFISFLILVIAFFRIWQFQLIATNQYQLYRTFSNKWIKWNSYCCECPRKCYC